MHGINSYSFVCFGFGLDQNWS